MWQDRDGTLGDKSTQGEIQDLFGNFPVSGTFFGFPRPESLDEFKVRFLLLEVEPMLFLGCDVIVPDTLGFTVDSC